MTRISMVATGQIADRIARAEAHAVWYDLDGIAAEIDRRHGDAIHAACARRDLVDEWISEVPIERDWEFWQIAAAYRRLQWHCAATADEHGEIVYRDIIAVTEEAAVAQARARFCLDSGAPAAAATVEVVGAVTDWTV